MQEGNAASIELATALRDPLAAARAAKVNAPVVGFVSNNVPIELIHAAGCFPLQLPGAQGGPTPRADRYMERAFDPMARSVFERTLRGDFDFVDLMVLPRTVDSFQRLYYYLCELCRTGIERVPESYLYDLLHTPWYTSAEHNHGRTVDFKERLQALTGRTITADDLAASIAVYNRIRRRLSDLFDRRCAVPCELAGTDALNVYRGAQQIRPDVFERALVAKLAERPNLAPGKRILLVGSAHDTPALHATIASAGGQVVADYHWRGELLFGPLVDESVSPLRALSTHYHRESWSVRRFPSSTADLLDFARRASVKGAIFYYYAEDEALPWDYPAQASALSALGVRSLRLDAQPYPPNTASDAAIAEFIADLPSGPTVRAEEA
jgi:benzoyl-CoA reductase/2-hydroxyglutaryl-CoA dehydratase subunit BcrC/BadD/HgdB